MSADKPVVIAQISDLHCGSVYYRSALADAMLDEVNALRPDIVVVTGDLTDMGLHDEYLQARALLDRIECERMLVVPGNHDARNVGEVHFESLFGSREPRDRARRRAPHRHRLLRARPRQRARGPREVPLDRGALRPSPPSSRSSPSTTTWCRSRAPAASATSSRTPVTCCAC